MEIIRLPVLEAGARLTAYLHDNCPDELPNRLKRPALVICPGGGYEFLSRREFDPPAMAFLQEAIWQPAFPFIGTTRIFSPPFL